MGDSEKTVSFRADAATIDTLDSLAAARDRSRSYLINEALTNYLELAGYHDALVHKGLEQMRNGQTKGHAEVVKRFNLTGRSRRSSSNRSSAK